MAEARWSQMAALAFDPKAVMGSNPFSDGTTARPQAAVRMKLSDLVPVIRQGLGIHAKE